MLIHDGPVSFNSSGEAYVAYPVVPASLPPPKPSVIVTEGDPATGMGRWLYDQPVSVKGYAPPMPNPPPEWQSWQHGTVLLQGPAGTTVAVRVEG